MPAPPFRPRLLEGVEEPGFVEVTYETAARTNDPPSATHPFTNLLCMSGVPNANTRLCTTEMKISKVETLEAEVLELRKRPSQSMLDSYIKQNETLTVELKNAKAALLTSMTKPKRSRASV